MIPAGGNRILAARLNGLRPEGYVFLSLVGPAKIAPLILINDTAPINDLDLRMLKDLDIVILHAARSISRLLDLVNVLCGIGVNSLECLNVATGQNVSVIAFGERYIKETPPCI